MDDDRAEEVDGALRKVEGHLSAHFDSESWDGIKDFSSWPCDCCHSRLAGSRHRFAVLGEVEAHEVKP